MNNKDLITLQKECEDLKNALKELTPEELEYVVGGFFDEISPTKTKGWFSTEEK